MSRPGVWSRHADYETAERARRFQLPDEGGGPLWRVCFDPLADPRFPWALIRYRYTEREEAGMADRPQLPVGPIRDLIAKCSEASRDDGQGMSLHELKERTGQPFSVVRKRCAALEAQGLLRTMPGAVLRYGVTDKGRDLL